MKNIYKLFTLLFIGSLLMTSCNTSDLEPSLEQNKSVEGSIKAVSDLEGVIKGAYNYMTSSSYYGRDFIINNEVRTDNCFSNGNSGRFTTEASLKYNSNNGFFFAAAYRAIAAANIVIGTDVSKLTGDQAYGKHLQGEAYAIRALVHFDLLKQYGQQNSGGTLGVPYVKEFKGSDLFPSRNTITENVTDIYADLDTAFGDMSSAYFDSSKITMSKYTAMAIKSRVGLYFKDWPVARDAANAVIQSHVYSIMSKANYVSSWAVGSNGNSIFELAFSATDNAGINGLAYIYRTTGGGSYGDVQVIDDVINLYDAGDVRAGILGYEGTMLRNIGKYPNNQGYDDVVVIRYEEVILNYAEALWRISQNATDTNALTYINMITSNRGAATITTLDENAFLNERRKEFIFEGMRFDDLMRTGKDITKSYMQQNFLATIPYGDHRLAWPIPKYEIDANSNMVPNPGY